MRQLALFVTLALLASAGAQAQQSVVVPATTDTISITGTVAARTKIVTGSAGKSIYVTALMLVPAATSAVTFSYGTGTDCGTGTTNLTGTMTFNTGQTVTLGSGYGTVLRVPAGNDLCITVSTAAAPGTLSYAIF
jgi:hypothetical protein